MKKQHIEQFLCQLVDIPSITGDELAVSQFLQAYLEEKGMTVETQQVADDRYNLYAYFDENPRIVLTTHMDTVAPFFPSSIIENRLFGRGSCDAKGQIASMIYALDILEKDIQKDVGLLFVVGEETDSIGAKSLSQTTIRPKYFINGEPTLNKLVRAQKGTLFFEASAKGLASHSGYPENGDSAIHKLMDYLQKLRQYAWPRNGLFGDTTFNVGKITGGDAINSLADKATAACGFRLVSSGDALLKQVLKMTPEDIEIKVITNSDPLELFVPEKITDTISVSYSSDVFHIIKSTGSKVLMCGPGTILNAHTVNESVGIEELNEAARYYAQLIQLLIQNN